jgi:hypothetical protein
MFCFRFYAMDRKNQIVVRDDLVAADKYSAISRALTTLSGVEEWVAFELWQNARRIHKERRAGH